MRPETTHPELTILMPCLNEAETIATCVKKASNYLSKSNIRGEILAPIMAQPMVPGRLRKASARASYRFVSAATGQP